MARSAGDPKVRYIGFRLDSPEPVPRKALIEAIRKAGEAHSRRDIEAAAPWLTRFDGTYGIVRCNHTHVRLVRDMLPQITQAPGGNGTVTVTVETLGTAGTIRSLVDKHLPGLKDAGQRR